jgi:ribosome-associated translation inhibitor RaiA
VTLRICSERKSNMQSALQITGDDMPQSVALDARIREKVVKLEKVCPRLAACRVAVSAQPRRAHDRRLFTVQLSITYPGGEIVVTRNHHEDLMVVLRDAFIAGRRALDNCVSRNGGGTGHSGGCGCRSVAARPEPVNA